MKHKPEKEKTPRSGELLRGDDGTFNIAAKAFDGKIPQDAFNDLEHEATGIIHGVVTLTVHVKDGRLSRYVIGRERSYVPGKPMTGSDG